MTFSQGQLDQLKAPLSRDVVKTREQGRSKVSYVEAWHVIAEANRIFGFDKWTRETVEAKCVSEKPRKIGVKEGFAGYDGWGVTYVCRVRVVVDGVAREGCGAGHGIDRDAGQAHESAVKEAETDAMKRALMTFGNPFGLALYDKAQTNVADDGDEAEASTLRYIAECKAKIAAFNETDRDGIARWWHSDEQRKARRDFQLHQDEVDELRALVTAKAKLPGT